MEDEYVSFVDGDCNEISHEGISSHIGLANLIVESDEVLKEEYKKSGRKTSVEFLILDKGYFSKSTMQYYRQIVYSKLNISDKQRKLMAYLVKEEGYKLKEESQYYNKDNSCGIER